ncbi:hypothetical protein Tco_0149902 [Tanacetum coccineum]
MAGFQRVMVVCATVGVATATDLEVAAMVVLAVVAAASVVADAARVCQERSEARGLHYLLDKVVQVGMYRDLSLHTSEPLQDPTTATITTITITNGDGMRRVRIFRETISPEYRWCGGSNRSVEVAAVVVLTVVAAAAVVAGGVAGSAKIGSGG